MDILDTIDVPVWEIESAHRRVSSVSEPLEVFDFFSPLWEPTTTEQKIEDHPLSHDVLVQAVLESWKEIYCFGSKKFRVGVQLLPSPQVVGNLLHDLVPLVLNDLDGRWVKAKSRDDKDLVFLPDRSKSIELKTSSANDRIFGNRSYTQEVKNPTKDKSGFYLAVNFEKISKSNRRSEITLIRFGWLDHGDWNGQESSSGQAAHLPIHVEREKLLTIYRR